MPCSEHRKWKMMKTDTEFKNNTDKISNSPKESFHSVINLNVNVWQSTIFSRYHCHWISVWKLLLSSLSYFHLSVDRCAADFPVSCVVRNVWFSTDIYILSRRIPSSSFVVQVLWLRVCQIINYFDLSVWHCQLRLM